MGCGASGDMRRSKPTSCGGGPANVPIPVPLSPSRSSRSPTATAATAAVAMTNPNRPAGSLDYKFRVYSFNDIYTIDNL